jgi:hypothetical protein
MPPLPGIDGHAQAAWLGSVCIRVASIFSTFVIVITIQFTSLGVGQPLDLVAWILLVLASPAAGVGTIRNHPHEDPHEAAAWGVIA